MDILLLKLFIIQTDPLSLLLVYNSHRIFKCKSSLLYNWSRYLKISKKSLLIKFWVHLSLQIFRRIPSICKYWAPLSILEISWATDIQLRWLKMFCKSKPIIYNFIKTPKAESIVFIIPKQHAYRINLKLMSRPGYAWSRPGFAWSRPGFA